MLTGLKRQLGFDTRSEKYTYISDEQQGYTAAERLAENDGSPRRAAIAQWGAAWRSECEVGVRSPFAETQIIQSIKGNFAPKGCPSTTRCRGRDAHTIRCFAATEPSRGFRGKRQSRPSFHVSVPSRPDMAASRSASSGQGSSSPNNSAPWGSWFNSGSDQQLRWKHYSFVWPARFRAINDRFGWRWSSRLHTRIWNSPSSFY